MLTITSIDGNEAQYCDCGVVVNIPSDLVIVVQSMTDREGNGIEFLRDGKVCAEFYFRFYIPGELSCFEVSSVLDEETGDYVLTNALVDEGVLKLVFDHDKYPFHSSGHLHYRQMSRSESGVFDSGFFEVWDEGKLPIVFKYNSVVR